jgi:hypothetical protein
VLAGAGSKVATATEAELRTFPSGLMAQSRPGVPSNSPSVQQTHSSGIHLPVTRDLYRKIRRLLLDLARELREIDRTFDDPGPDPEGARAARLWVTYIVIYLADFAESAAELNEDRHSRALAVLSRTTYEYVISMIYLFRHKDIADKQMLTQGARFYKRGLGLRLPESEQLYQAAYKAWLEDAKGSGMNEFTGSFRFLTAALEVENETKEHCPMYAGRYGMMSAIAHPDAEGFPDTFAIDNETRTIKIAPQSSMHSFDFLFVIAADLVRVMEFLKGEVHLEVPTLAVSQQRLKKHCCGTLRWSKCGLTLLWQHGQSAIHAAISDDDTTNQQGDAGDARIQEVRPSHRLRAYAPSRWNVENAEAL